MPQDRQRILITGASSGLGRQLARRFAEQGRDLALCARRLDRLEELRDELLAISPNSNIVLRQLDVTDFDDVLAAIPECAEQLGGLDRMIVNAGMMAGGRLGTGKFHDNALTLQTNVVGALAQVEAALQIFRKQGHGHLVMVSSMSAFRGLGKYLTTYAASKRAVAHLMEGVRVDLVGTKIKTTTLYPGFIRTELNENAGKMLFEVNEETGAKALHRAIEQEKAQACVPWWPWALMSLALRLAPDSMVRKM